MNVVDSGCTPAADALTELRNVQLGLFAFAAEYRSITFAALYAQIVAVTLAVLPAVRGPPSVDAITMPSLDSSEWNVPELPSAHELLIVFG